jgi:hypothetical protein
MSRLRATPAQLREFFARDWGLFERSSREAWRRRLEQDGPGALLHAVDGLRRYLQAVDPGWPTSDDRARELEDLIQFKQRLDAASHALTGRPRPR